MLSVVIIVLLRWFWFYCWQVNADSIHSFHLTKHFFDGNLLHRSKHIHYHYHSYVFTTYSISNSKSPSAQFECMEIMKMLPAVAILYTKKVLEEQTENIWWRFNSWNYANVHNRFMVAGCCLSSEVPAVSSLLRFRSITAWWIRCLRLHEMKWNEFSYSGQFDKFSLWLTLLVGQSAIKWSALLQWWHFFGCASNLQSAAIWLANSPQL